MAVVKAALKAAGLFGSPSPLARKLARWFPAGIVQGIRDKIPEVGHALADMRSLLSDSMAGVRLGLEKLAEPFVVRIDVEPGDVALPELPSLNIPAEVKPGLEPLGAQPELPTTRGWATQLANMGQAALDSLNLPRFEPLTVSDIAPTTVDVEPRVGQLELPSTKNWAQRLVDTLQAGFDKLTLPELGLAVGFSGTPNLAVPAIHAPRMAQGLAVTPSGQHITIQLPTMPEPLTPEAQAVNARWQRVIAETNRALRSRGFRFED